jgi:ubiquinol-cytochrome c reductase iron-sulfur subunit
MGRDVEHARGRAKAETRATWLFGLSAAASLALAVVYWRGGQPQLEGILLATISGGIGAAVVTWAKHSLPHDAVTEDRHPVASSEEDIEAFTDDFERIEVEPDPSGVGRRRALVVAATAALAAFGAALIFPLRSLGPRPGKGLKVTPYKAGGLRVVTDEGAPVKPEDIASGGLITVWPEGHVGAADASTLLIRTRRDQEFVPRPGREGWRVGDVVAYSKLCTHVGCPVGLYQSEEALLLCPCHQSTFAVLDGARPIFGPAARSLPQLPLGLNDEGEIIAEGDFSGPVGPGFWDRDR